MRLLIELLRLLQFVIFIRVLLTWIMPGQLPAAIRPVANVIDNVLRHFRVLIPMGPGFIDLGPLLLMLLLEVIAMVVTSMAYSGFAYQY